MSKEVIKRECKFAFHIPIADTPYQDVHLVKESLYYNDGSKEPNLRFIKNFKRPFWVTKPQFQNHKEKKEYEELDKLTRIECTESKLRYRVAEVLNKHGTKDYLKQLLNSPYIYGADIPSESLIKESYKLKYPDVDGVFDVAMLDTETDVLHGTNDIILITIAFKNNIFTAVTKDFVNGIDNATEKEYELIVKYLSDKIDVTKYNFELMIGNSSMQIVSMAFDKLHEWKPDFVAIWNMEFDINKILETCTKFGVDPKNLFSDPKVPEELRYFKYKKGSEFKITASGKRKPKAPHDLWNTVYSTSSFYFIDAMCAYKYIRLSKAEEPSYKLDAILTKELKLTKLKFDEAKALEGSLEWHSFMQEHYPLEYIVYNRFDCISMQLLDDKTSDLKAVVPTFSGLSPFEHFASQPRLIANALFYFLKDRNKILATVGSDKEVRDSNGVVIDADYTGEEDEDDEGYDNTDILGLKGWIVTLQNAFIDESTASDCIEENVLSKGNIRTYVYDCDTISAYPSCLISLNISKRTTSKEIIEILDNDEKIDERVFKLQNINLVSGCWTNALEYCTTMFNFPTLDELDKYIK